VAILINFIVVKIAWRVSFMCFRFKKPLRQQPMWT